MSKFLFVVTMFISILLCWSNDLMAEHPTKAKTILKEKNVIYKGQDLRQKSNKNDKLIIKEKKPEHKPEDKSDIYKGKKNIRDRDHD